MREAQRSARPRLLRLRRCRANRLDCPGEMGGKAPTSMRLGNFTAGNGKAESR